MVNKVIGIYKIYFRDENGVLHVTIANDPAEIRPPNVVVKVESNRPTGCFKCC
jgi:hypothetical protein